MQVTYNSIALARPSKELFESEFNLTNLKLQNIVQNKK